MSRVAANEWGADGINVKIICPLAWTAQLENFEKAYLEAFKENVKMPPEMESQIARTSLRSILKQVAKSITPADVQQLNAALNKIKKES